MILESIIGAATGPISGLIGVAINAFASHKSAEQALKRAELEFKMKVEDNKTDLALHGMNLKARGEEREFEMAVATEENDTARLTASYNEAKATLALEGVAPWVRTLSASVRPVLSYAAWIFLAGILFLTATPHAVELFGVDIAGEVFAHTVTVVLNLCSAITVYWFGIRGQRNHGQVKR